MNRLFDTVLQTLKDRLPNISWRVGSLVRELLVEPMLHIGNVVDQVIEDIRHNDNLSDALADPVNNEKTLDSWMSRLNLSAITARKSVGKVDITFSGSDTLTIPASTEFSWGDSIKVRSSKAVELSLLAGTAREIGGGCYVGSVPVETLDNTGYTITSGTRLNWINAPNRVLDIYVSSTVTGGVSGLSALNKARVIEAKLGSSLICGEQTTLNALINGLDNVVCDVRFGARHAADGFPVLPIYIKQLAAPRTVQVELTPAGDGDYTLELNSVVSLVNVETQAGQSVDFNVNYISDNVAMVHVPNAGNTKLNANVLMYTDVEEVCSWLRDRQRGVIASLVPMTPVYCEVSVNISGISDVPADAVVAISEHINNLGFNPTIQDKDVSAILSKYGVTTDSAITYVADVKYRNITKKLKQTGGINLSVIGGIGGTPVAVYCPATNIRAV